MSRAGQLTTPRPWRAKQSARKPALGLRFTRNSDRPPPAGWQWPLPEYWRMMERSCTSPIRHLVSSQSSRSPAWSCLVVAAILVTDYRGFLTSYARGCWRFYQRPSYRRLFLWTSRSRAYYGDEARVRRTLRLVAVPGLVIGVLILSLEFVSLATGHVS